MKNNISIVVFCVVAAFTIHLVLNSLIALPISYHHLLGMHLVLGVLILLILIALNIVQKQLPEKLGMTFMGLVTFKMLVSATYVLFVYRDLENVMTLVVHFFGLYMFYLIVEVVLALQVLRKSST